MSLRGDLSGQVRELEHNFDAQVASVRDLRIQLSRALEGKRMAEDINNRRVAFIDQLEKEIDRLTNSFDAYRRDHK